MEVFYTGWYNPDSRETGMAPTFLEKPQVQQDFDKRRLILQGLMRANPEPSVNWFHNDQPLSSNAHIALLSSCSSFL